MKRTLIQLDDKVYRALRQRAFREERSIASLVREMVASGLDEGAGRARRRTIGEFSSVRAGRSKQDRHTPVSKNHDDALADAFRK
jgi:plasmid stability protein